MAAHRTRSLVLWAGGLFGLLPTAGAAAQLTWKHIGPDLEVNVVAVAPVTGDTILASAFLEYTRQLYRTTDGGATWSAVEGVAGVMDLAVDPRRPRLMYAAAGSVLRSEDGGATWEPVTGDEGASVVALDPQSGRRVYVGTAYVGTPGGRVLRSGDWGQTWTDISGATPPWWWWEEVSDIIVDPGDTNTLYMSSHTFQDGDGIYKTVDGGLTWQRLGCPGELGVPPGCICSVSRMHVSADDSGRLIAGSGPDIVTGAIYETSDAGSTWNTLVVSGLPSIRYLRTLALEPLLHRQDTVFLGVDHWGGPDEIHYSLDSGRGWRTLVDLISDDSQHGLDIATDDSLRVYYTTASGVVRSDVPREPSLVYSGHVVDDSLGGDGDGHVDPGETVLLSIELRNLVGAASAVTAAPSSSDALIHVTQPHSGYADLIWGDTGASLTPYQFEASPARPRGPVEFTLEIAAGGFSRTETFFVDPGILLVDDDDFAFYEDAYQDALADNHLAYRRWSVVPDGPVTADLLGAYDVVVWFTSAVESSERATTLSSAEEDLLADYLDGGGRLLVSSQDYTAEFSGAPPSEFASEYLHMAGFFANTAAPGVIGVAGDPIGDGVVVGALEYPFQNRSDSVFPDPLAARVLNPSPGVGAAAIRFPSVPDSGGFRTVFLAFPFESIPDGGVPPNGRATIMRRAIEWLVPEGGLVPTGVPGAEQAAHEPGEIEVHCFPNPTRGSVDVVMSPAPDRDRVRVSIYDIGGRLVWSSDAGERDSAGTRSVTWSGCDDRGERVSSGVYFVRVTVGEHRTHAKLVRLR